MLFIGIKEKLEVIPFDQTRPDFYVEVFDGEFKPVADKFENKNIYFIIVRV